MVSSGMICNLTIGSRLGRVLLALAMLGGAQAHAITLDFTGSIGTVNDTSGYFQGRYHVGDAFTGHVSYEPAAATTLGSPSATYAGYGFPSTTSSGIFATLDGDRFSTLQYFELSLQVVQPGTGLTTQGEFDGDPGLPGTDSSQLRLQFADPTNTALSNTSIPTSFPLASWPQFYFEIIAYLPSNDPFGFGGPGPVSIAWGSLSTIAPHQDPQAPQGTHVPEPALVGLLVLGGLGVARRGPRR